MEICGFDVTVTSLQIALVLVLATVYILIQLKLKSRINDQNKQTGAAVPGPKPSDPVHGNFPDIVKAGSLPEYLQRMHAQYGEVVRIWFGQDSVVSTASPRVFKEQIRLFDKPEMSFLAPVFGNRSIQFVNGEEAKQRRRNYDAFLNKESVERYFEIFKQISCGMVEELRARQDSDHVNIYDVMFHMTCKSVGIALFGEYFEDDANVRSFKTLYDEFWPVLEKNFTNGLPEKGTQERIHFDTIVAEVHSVVKNVIEEHKQNKQVRRFIDVVMETGLDETTIYGDILVYLVGGFHSVSTTLTWCMFHAVIYPDMQDAIYDEVFKVTNNDELCQRTVPKLKYLKSFIDETLRLRFVAPVATRLSGENTVIAGYKIPQGTHIIQALCTVLTSGYIWSDPHGFNPQRFINTTDNPAEKRAPLSFCPFGFAGRRMCPGKQFFYSEALLILGTLFKRFKFELSDETPKDIPIIYGLLTRPAVDVCLKIKERL